MPIDCIKELCLAHRKGVLVEALQINQQLELCGGAWSDLEKWIKANNTIEIRFGNNNINAPQPKKAKCPKCGNPMSSSILFNGSDKYKEGYRTYWLCGASCCTNKGCGYEEFSKLTKEEYILSKTLF